MSSFPRNLFPISFKRANPGKDSLYHVDTSELFLQDDDASSKERPRSWQCCGSEETNMTFYRLFYFLFNAAMALFAYLPLYCKQYLLLDHRHVGILMGIRPICKFLGAPLLGSLADKFNRYKLFLYGGLLTYIAVYLSITFIDGAPGQCGPANHINVTEYVNETLCNITSPNFTNCISALNPKGKQRRIEENGDNNRNERNVDLPIHGNEWKTDRAAFGRDGGKDYVNQTAWGSEMNVMSEGASWPLDVYRVWKRRTETKSAKLKKFQEQVFMILLLLIILAEFLGAPIPTLADTATLQNLRKEPYKYGYQRAWGSLGFGLMSIIFGSILYITVPQNEDINNCPENLVGKFRPVFYCFCALLVLTVISTFQFHFRQYEGKDTNGCSIFTCIKYFENVEYILFVFLAWFTGLAHGLSNSFIYVYLIHIGATPLNLLVTASVQSVSKIIFFLLSPSLIIKYGNFTVIYIGLVANMVIFFCYSFLGTPWVAVPIELLGGLATSCIWAALVSYVGAPPKIGATLQGILHATHTGLGRGIGGLFGGMILAHYGFDWLFRLFSLATFFVFLMVAGFRYWRKKEIEPIWKALWDYSPITNDEKDDE